ncbi:MAG: hypothetical protein A2X86_19010 [Bdellovibrionales bacterium GWA2_49_15]|nr:MAG: hypothetical protein A2X86_19010 [Bdellovibrionales bacterium GWA2_49_15]HAZ14317.1 hypothetical protein [Bdellovibrionales bacterium]
MKKIFAALFALACLAILSCNQDLSGLTGVNPVTGIPYSTTDTVEALSGGQAQYSGAMSRWRDRVASTPNSTSAETYPSGPSCIRPNAGFTATQLAQEFMSKSKRYRESLGGHGCQCIPMGELCLPNICNCSEICPNDHGIFQSQASQIMPTAENQLAFTNDGNSTAYAKYPNKEGFCSGLQLQRRKFSSLARFRPTLHSYPAMTVPSPTYVRYIKTQIDRMLMGQNPNFLGARNLRDLRRKDPEIDRYFKEKTGDPDLGSAESDAIATPSGDGTSYRPSNWASPTVSLHFEQPGLTNIPALTAQDPEIDPATGAAYGAIPEEGTPQFVSYLAKKVERVAQGFPATLPGYSNLKTLSSHPTYKEIIGRYSAIDWQQVNALDTQYANGAPPFYSDDWPTRAYQPMNTGEADSLLDGLEDRLPAFPGSGTGPWNANGPWQGVSLKIRGALNPAQGTGSGNSSYNHAVEAYALQRLPSGEVNVCIADPNLNLNHGDNENCNNHITIPAKGANGQRGPLSYNSTDFSPRILGQVGINPSSDRYQGVMTTRMVEYCRTINRGKFNVQDCSGSP